MGSYRQKVKDKRHKLLVPLSFGLSSTVLLHILHGQIERMQKTFAGPAYDLHVLVVEPSTITPRPSHSQSFDLVQKTFPLHSYSQVPFHSIFDYDPDIQAVISEFAGEGFVDNTSLSDKERLDAFRASISTATSKADVDYVLLNRLVVACAKKFGCTGVLWGDSDSRLAAKTLANVAKGRGSSVTWQVSDGMSPWGLAFNFPLRELYTVELQQYANLCPELQEIIIPDEQPSENVLTKNLSIDELMMRYVLNQGAKYPGVMANVTRTASKLQPLSVSSDDPVCALCGGLLGNPDGNLDLAAPGNLGSGGSPFCYGCTRSRPDVAR